MITNKIMRDSTTELEEAASMLISPTLPAKKRPFNQEEEEKKSIHDNKKMKNKTWRCFGNPSPKLLRKFTFYKNKAWGSTWKEYFVTFFKKKTNKTKINAQHTPPLPQIYREKVVAMGGSEPILVIQKRLFKSDSTQQPNRFSIPHKQMATEFLNNNEKENLKDQPLEVTLIDPSLREWTLNLNSWNMNSEVYVLISPNWYKLVWDNKLEEGMKVQLWSFRVGSKLCFVLVRLDCH